MYCITDAQIEYILNDIRRNGIETEDLQLNLLDHICCIIEQELKEDDDFERFYHNTIKQFYKKELREIEVETINLLTFKNYYAMKKLMVACGLYTVIAFVAGSFFKIMYWPGANVLLVSAIGVFSLIFLPLMFLLKTKEAKNQRDKWVLGIGTLVGILYCLSTVFLIQHWQGSRILWLTTLSLAFFVLVPLFFFTGIRKVETKVNTIVATVILMGYLGLQFTMTSIRPSPETHARVYTYMQSEMLLTQALHRPGAENNSLVQDIQNTCQQLKAQVLQHDLGMTSIPPDFESTGLVIKERNTVPFLTVGKGHILLDALRAKVSSYNNTRGSENQIPVERSIVNPNFSNKSFCSSLFVLNNITQLQLFLANTQQNIVAAK